MPHIREIKLRIKSIQETRQITRAMKLISAAKLKKARQQLEQTLPYFKKVKETMQDILSHSGEVCNLYFDIENKKEGCKKGYFIITGDKGLAGGYNSNIIKTAEALLQDNPGSKIYVAGHVGKNHFNKKNYNMDMDFYYSVLNPTIYRAREIGEFLIEEVRNGKIDEAYIVYTHMVSAIKLEPRVIKILPLELQSFVNDPDSTGVCLISDDNMLYHPSPSLVFDILVSKYVKGIVYGTLVEAFTSEQSARMSAMDNATANADDMLQLLNLYYNRARQAAITQEISEIVGGAAALD